MRLSALMSFCSLYAVIFNGFFFGNLKLKDGVIETSSIVCACWFGQLVARRDFSLLSMSLCIWTMLQATAGVGSTLVASLSYSRYPVCQWGELAEVVRGIISTRVLQAPLPLHVLLTSGDERPWRRLQLADSNFTSKSNFNVSVGYLRQALDLLYLPVVQSLDLRWFMLPQMG